MAPNGPGGGVPYGFGIDPGQMARFCEAACRLYQAEPWDVVPSDEHVLAIRAPHWALDQGCVSVIGQMGESFGVLVFRSIDEYVAFRQYGMGLRRGRRPENMGAEIFSINFEEEVPAEVRRVFKRHGWKLSAPSVYPILLRTAANLAGRPISPDDVELARGTCEALSRLITEHEEELEDGPSEPVSERYAVDEGEIVLTAPHPEAEARGLAVWTGDEDEGDDDEEGDQEAAADDLTDAFAAAMAERGRDLAWINNAAFVCRQLCEYKIGYEGGDLDQLGPADFRGYMLDFFPRKVTADDSTIEFVPEALDLFAEWLGESGRISAQTAGRIRKVVKDAQKEFLRAARDPRNFGMAKSLFGSMKEAGVDIQDQAQVQGFINMYNASLAGGPVGPSPVGPPAKEARPPKDRWRPAPGEPPPVLTAPCPCGSGKRYKKCCMPR